MFFSVIENLNKSAKHSTLVLFVDSDKKVLKSEQLTLENLAEVEKLMELDNFKGSCGQVAHFYNLNSFKHFERLILVGIGKIEHGFTTADGIKKAFSSLVKKLSVVKAPTLTVLIPAELVSSDRPAYRTARLIVETINHSRYQFKRFFTLDKLEDGHSEDCSCCTGVKNVDFVIETGAPESKAFQACNEFEAGLIDGRCVSAGVKLARDLGNLPANICTPKYLSEIGEKLARDFENIEVDILDEKDLQKLGMNCYLAVGRGSVNRPYMTVVKYKGSPNANDRPYVFVGKGMTFDSGGYSIKPAANMEEMKYDMCGAASVLGLMKAVAELNLPINVIGVAAGCENLVDADAYRPGDIIKSLNGLTVEINNTDAEGRLVLCDALAYVDRFNPKSVIDIATLTGACVVALGGRLTGVFSNHDCFANQLIEAGQYVADYGWHLPVNDDYREDMRGNHADLTNAGVRWGGASTAAAFLSYFTKDYYWAHLDIAGTAWVSGKHHLATGRPVSLMVKWLQDQVNKGNLDACPETCSGHHQA